MFRFKRERILPLFLSRRMTVAELARKAGVSHTSAQRAVEGEKVAAPIIDKVAEILGIDAMDYLEGEKKKRMFTKQTVTITNADDLQKEIELGVDEAEKMLATWGEDDDINKGFVQYFSEKQKAAQ